MLPLNFKPKKNYNLIRLGSNNDGGYLLDPNSVTKTKTLIALGLGTDWNFEKSFIKKNESCNVHCFDFKINKSFWIKNIFKCIEKFILRKIKFEDFKTLILNNFEYRKFFRKKNIFFHETVIAKNKLCTNLDSIIKELCLTENLFLKIDIEGAEYRILDEIVTHQEKIVGIVIEFHDTDLHKEKIKKFIDNFSLKVIHIHPNNVDYLCKDNDPISIEMSFSKEPTIVDDKDVKFPHILDQKNSEKNSEHKLRFENI